MTIQERINEILKRKEEINELLNDEKRSKEVDLKEIEKEVRGLNEELQELETRQRLLDETKQIEKGEVVARKVETFNLEETRESKVDTDWEQRGNDIFEKRAVTVESGDLILPKHDSPNIKGTFNQVSSLIDNVTHVNLPGGESYETPYEIQHGEGNYTKEGEPYHDTDVEFGYAKINKTKITAYTELTEEVEKLPRAQYAQRVVNAVQQALRKKITKEILNGRGPEHDEFVGIFSDKATAINPATDLEIDEIDENTLDNIIYAFGGDEDVEGEFTLILHKDTLRQFEKVRYPDGRKVYDIVHNGNVGTINGVRYIINSGAKSFALAEDGDYVMAYGPLTNYELAIFSPVEVKRSDDYKFKEGMVAHRGSVFAGGNVVAHNGFLRVKKGVPEA